MRITMKNNTHKTHSQQGKSRFSLMPLIFFGIIAFFGYKFFMGSGSSSQLASEANSLTADQNGLYILAGSELKDLEPFIPEIKKATGVQIGFEYTGTLDGVDALTTGKQVDAAWFSHGKYLSLIDQSKIKSQSQIMLSPVVMGIKKSKAQAFGWVNADGTANTVTWQDIADKSTHGELNFAMTNPASSNSGFTALMGVVAALSGTSDAPQQADVDAAKPKLKAFFQGQALTSGSSGWLAEQFVKEQGRLDAMINYESVLMQLNQSGQLQEPLYLLYPKEGIVTADYPLMLINAEKKPAFDKLVAYLKSADFQQKMMAQTYRRPVNRQVQPAAHFTAGANKLLVELPFPNSHTVVDSILMSYQDEIRIPAHVLFVLDTSGSMSGEGIHQLRSAMLNLTQSGTGSSRFAKFSERERITLLPFSSEPYPPENFEVAAAAPENMERLQTVINALDASGSTAIYDSLQIAYSKLAEQKRQDEAAGKKRYYSVVLMTDGDNSAGQSFSGFEQFYRQLPANMQTVKTFTVLFGDANEAEMQEIAQLTGGRMFDGRKGDLSRVFKKIRGYQ